MVCTQRSGIVHFRNAFHFSGDVLRLSNPSLETIRVTKKIACSDKTYRQNVQFIQGVINTRVLVLYFLCRIIYFALSVTLREERRPKMLENKVLRMIFALPRDWRRLHKKTRGFVRLTKYY